MRMRIRVLVMVVLTLTTVMGCRRESEREPETRTIPPPQQTSPPEAADSSVTALRDDLVMNGLVNLGASRAEIVHTLGTPLRVERTAIPNKYYPETTDTLATLVYSGVAVSFYVLHDGTEYFSRVEIQDNRFLKYPELGIGATVEALEQALGSPTSRGPDYLEFTCVDCFGPDEPVVFHLDQGRVAKVEFLYYVD